MKRMKKTLTALLLSGGLLTGSMAGGMQAFAAGNQLGITVTAAVSGPEAQEINQYLNGSSLDLRITGGAENVLNLFANFQGKSIASLLLTLNNGRLTFSVPQADSNSYTADLQALFNNLHIQDMLDEYMQQSGMNGLMDENMMSGVTEIAESLETAVMPYAQIIGESIQRTVVTTQESVTMQNLGVTEDLTVMTYEPDAEELATLFEAFAGQIEQDQNLDSLITQFADVLKQVVPAASMASGQYVDTEEIDETFEELREMIAEAPQGLRETAGELRAQPEIMDDVTIRLTVGLRGEEFALMDALIASNYNGEAYGFTVEHAAAGNAVAVNMEGQTISFIQKGTASAGTLALKMMGMDLFNIVYNFDLASKSLLGLPYGSVVATIATGMMTGSSSGNSTISFIISGNGSTDDYTLQISGDIFQANSIPLQGATVKVTATDQVVVTKPSGQAIDISYFDMEKLGELLTNLGEKLMMNIQQNVGAF